MREKKMREKKMRKEEKDAKRRERWEVASRQNHSQSKIYWIKAESLNFGSPLESFIKFAKAMNFFLRDIF